MPLMSAMSVCVAHADTHNSVPPHCCLSLSAQAATIPLMLSNKDVAVEAVSWWGDGSSAVLL